MQKKRECHTCCPSILSRLSHCPFELKEQRRSLTLYDMPNRDCITQPLTLSYLRDIYRCYIPDSNKEFARFVQIHIWIC